LHKIFQYYTHGEKKKEKLKIKIVVKNSEASLSTRFGGIKSVVVFFIGFKTSQRQDRA